MQRGGTSELAGPSERSSFAAGDGLTTALIDGLGAGTSIDPRLRDPALRLADAYMIADRVRAARVADGARTVGRKIGFTNAELAATFGAPGPIWGWVYDRTLVRLADIAGLHWKERSHEETVQPLAGLAEPRLEPEIVLGLAHSPSSGMDERELAACVDRAALGFEIVQSVFPGWRFTAAEAVAGHGLHGALVVGPNLPLPTDQGSLSQSEMTDPSIALNGLAVRLERGGEAIATGIGANAHGGPLRALRWLVDELGRTGAAPLEAGEVVTTGTLTGAHPIGVGETWQAIAASPASKETVSLTARFG